ncbi:MAG: acyltransferase family protein [Allosphingosinicella sp.]
MSSAPHPKRLDHIEILRGVAVLLVLLYHLRAPGFSFAYLGVDAFFVISGFLMALLYGGMASGADVSGFYRRRLSRLLPAYYAALIVAVVAAAAIVLPHEFADVVRYADWSALLAPNIGFWFDASYFDYYYFRPILNFWSLGVELQFYLLFPLIAIGARRFPKTVILLSLASFGLYLLVYSVSPKTAFFMTPPRIWQFMIGFYLAGRVSRLPRGTGEAALAALVATLLAAPFLPVSPTVFAAAIALLAGLYIFAGLAPRSEGSAPGRALVLLGRYSYSVYLVHFPVIAFLAYRPFGGTRLDLTPAGIAAALVLTILLSGLLYHFVEVPLRRRRSARFIAGLAAAGAVAAAGVAAAAVPLNGALLPPRQQLAISAWFDRLPYRCPKLGRLIHPTARSCRIAGEGGPGVLLVGDSHADLLKGVLGEEVARAGGHLDLMVTNEPLGPALPAEAVIADAKATGARAIVVHSLPEHVHLDALASLAALAGREGISVAFIDPVPPPGFNVPRHIYSLLQAGQTPRPTRSLADYRRGQRPLLDRVRAIPGVTLYAPQDLLCTPLCAIEDGAGHPLYSDEGHLSQTGVKRIRPMLRAVAATIAPTPSGA